jgi:hypothetical protein
MPRYSPSFFSLSSSFSATVGPILVHRFGSDGVSKVTLSTWPSQGLDAIVYLQALRPICILVRTRTLFCFIYDLDLCMYIWILDSWSLRGYYIFFRGFHRELV